MARVKSTCLPHSLPSVATTSQSPPRFLYVCACILSWKTTLLAKRKAKHRKIRAAWCVCQAAFSIELLNSELCGPWSYLFTKKFIALKGKLKSQTNPDIKPHFNQDYSQTGQKSIPLQWTSPHTSNCQSFYHVMPWYCVCYHGQNNAIQTTW